MPKRGLGRGLDSLIPDRTEGSAAKKSEKTAGKNSSKTSKTSKSAKGAGKNSSVSSSKISKSAKTENSAAAKPGKTGKPAVKTDKKTQTKAAKTTKTNKTESTKPESAKTERVKAAKAEAAKAETAKAEAAKAEAAKAEAAKAEAAKAELSETAAAGIETSGTETAGAGITGTETVGTEETADKNSVEKQADAVDRSSSDGEVVQMRISLVEPNRSQPRKYFDDYAISELADSIRQFGIIQPLLVQKKDGYYEIIAGERRWRAAQKAGLKEVPVIIREFSNQEAVEVALVENIQREDLNPIEEAKAYERLVEEYGLSQEEVAGRVSKSRSAVTNSMRLLRLEDSVQKMVETSQISEGHARALLGLPTSDAQKKAAEQIVKDHLSVRQTEKLVREANRPAKEPKAQKTDAKENAMLQGLSENLKTVLGTKVSIHATGRNSGRIEIEYYSEEELDRLYELLLGTGE